MYEVAGVTPYFVAQVPNQKIDPKRVYRLFWNDKSDTFLKYSTTVTEHEKYQKSTNDVLKNIISKESFIDFTDVLCANKICPMGTHSFSYYIDDDHLGKQGAELLINKIFLYL